MSVSAIISFGAAWLTVYYLFRRFVFGTQPPDKAFAAIGLLHSRTELLSKCVL